MHAMAVSSCVHKSMAIDQRDGGREKNENYARSKTVKKTEYYWADISRLESKIENDIS